MNVLIVYAHFEQKSFNAAMRATAESALGAAGHGVAVSDLYAERFNPVPDPADFAERADPGHFELMREQAHANAVDLLPCDLRREQARVLWADAILFQFPFWWWSLPAILKGWVDRVLSNGFAYGSRNLAGKCAMLCLTAETKARRFAADAGYPILEHVEGGMLRYCGLNVLPRFVAPEILSVSAGQREQVLTDFAAHLQLHLSARQQPPLPTKAA